MVRGLNDRAMISDKVEFITIRYNGRKLCAGVGKARMQCWIMTSGGATKSSDQDAIEYSRCGVLDAGCPL